MKTQKPSEIVRDTIKTWDCLFGPLISDVFFAYTSLEKDPSSDFWRRCFVRTLVTMIEAESFVLEKVALAINSSGYATKAKSYQDVHYSNVKEFAECSPRKSGKKSTIRSEIRFAAALVIIEEETIQTRTTDFSVPALKLFKVFRIRNRIVHPKTTKDLRISEAELTTVKDYLRWHEARVHPRIGKCLSGLLAISQN